MSFFLIQTAIAMMSASPEHEPLIMAIVRREDHWELAVVGTTDKPMQVTYALEKASGLGNRSVQRGRAFLTPGERVEVVRMVFRPGGETWSAKLEVQTPTSTYTQSLP